MNNYLKKMIWLVGILMTSLSVMALPLINPITINDNQNIYHYIPHKDLEKTLLTADQQKSYVQKALAHFFAPWDSNDSVTSWKIYTKTSDIRGEIKKRINTFSRNLGWGENYQAHTKQWLDNIVDNMDWKKFPNTNEKAIVIHNAYLRVFPTIDPHYNYFKKAGEGYPFDNFQDSVVRAGTPLHMIQISKDKGWAFVKTPFSFGWIQVPNIAIVNNDFVRSWENGNYAVVVKNNIPVANDKTHQFMFNAQVGALFPIQTQTNNKITVLVPTSDINRQAELTTATVSSKNIQPFPLSPTLKNFAAIINELNGMTYGWGGLNFYSDCSGTLQMYFLPFGILLSSFSEEQPLAGRVISMKDLSASKRKEILATQGVPFLSIIHPEGHVILYLGIINNKIMTFQNAWGAKTQSGNETGRDVIGKAVIVPLDYARNLPNAHSAMDAPFMELAVFQ